MYVMSSMNEKFINRRLNPEKGQVHAASIVVVIDEFGDLIMTAGKEVELPIAASPSWRVLSVST